MSHTADDVFILVVILLLIGPVLALASFYSGYKIGVEAGRNKKLDYQAGEEND